MHFVLPPVPVSPMFRDPPGLRVIVTGGRAYGLVINKTAEQAFREEHVLYEVLDAVHAASPVVRLIQGGAKGADELAARWARERGIPEVQTFLPNWKLHGNKAGVLRNEEMVKQSQADLAIAFPGGRGTADCVRQLYYAKVQTIGVPNV